MADPSRRVILDGVEYSQIFQFPKLLGACTAALQPSRLLIGLIMVTAVLTFGRIWDAATSATVHPDGLSMGNWSIEDAASHQDLLRDAMRRFAPSDEVPPEGQSWPTLHPREVLEGIQRHAATGIESSFYENADEARVAYEHYVSRIRPLTPMKVFEATIEHVSISFRHLIRGTIRFAPLEVFQGFRGLGWQLPQALWREHRLFGLALGVLTLLVYILGGGALSRMAACEFAGHVSLKLDEAVDFAMLHWIRLGIAVILPLALVAVLGVFIMLLGALMLVPILDILGGVLYGVALLIGLVLAFVLVGYAGAFGLILPAVACENCDGPDAGQKAISFLYLRPLHMIGYALVGFIGLVIGYLVVSLFAMILLNTTALLFGVMSSHPALSAVGGAQWLDLSMSEGDLGGGRIASGLIMFWQTVVICLVASYVVSYICDVCTRIFLLLRRACDDQDIEEIWWSGMAPGTIAPVDSRPSAGDGS